MAHLTDSPFEFSDAGPTLVCTACGAPTRRVVVRANYWDGNAVCDNEACASEVMAVFGDENHPAVWEWRPLRLTD